MEKRSLKDKMIRVKCANCAKPFHFAPEAESGESGAEEIALECPYCQTQLIVAVPRQYLKTQVMFRGSSRELESRKAQP